DLQQRERIATKDVVATRFDVAVAGAKAACQYLRLGRVVRVHDGLPEQLQEHVVEAGQGLHGAVVVLHQLFNGEAGLVAGVAEQGGHADLVVEEQPVFAAPAQHVQGEAHAPQKRPAAQQFAVFILGQKTVRHQLVQAPGRQQAPGDPDDHVNVAQAAGAFLDVRFEVVGGI